VTTGISNGLSIHHLLLSQFLGEHAGSPLQENRSKETIKMVKARGYELLSDPQLKLGVDLRGFGLTIGISV
jgi:hypothetical protein